GAFERQPAATPLQAGNLLRDPGAEAGGAWAFANGFTRERYGAFPFPSAAAAGALEATFRDPAGAAIRTVALAAPTAAQRANVTTLQPRARTDAVPRLTRAIDVTMRATRAGAGEYDDAYFDNVALTFVAPGA